MLEAGGGRAGTRCGRGLYGGSEGAHDLRLQVALLAGRTPVWPDFACTSPWLQAPEGQEGLGAWLGEAWRTDVQVRGLHAPPVGVCMRCHHTPPCKHNASSCLIRCPAQTAPAQACSDACMHGCTWTGLALMDGQCRHVRARCTCVCASGDVGGAAGPAERQCVCMSQGAHVPCMTGGAAAAAGGCAAGVPALPGLVLLRRILRRARALESPCQCWPWLDCWKSVYTRRAVCRGLCASFLQASSGIPTHAGCTAHHLCQACTALSRVSTPLLGKS